MTALLDEVRTRFPEVHDHISEGDEELPYVLMAYIVEWLQSLPGPHSHPEVVNRVVAFCRWCEDQPRTDDAGTDLFTIVVVGFYEKLFKSPKTRRLLPKLIPLEDIEANAAYYQTWVGTENYSEALR